MYPEIEKSYYKLWLSSTNILLTLLHNKVHIQSQIEREYLERISKVYVMNDSYAHAKSILQDNRFVVLSGNPGVGKTTLARVLAWEFVELGFELVVAVNSINDAYDAYVIV